MKNTETLYAVSGQPILHSLSPEIFLQLTQFKNKYTRICTSHPSEAIALFKSLGLKGMNVTAPFKEKIISYLDHIDDKAAAIGSINTVIAKGDRLIGFNTDYFGIIDTLKLHQCSLDNKKCLIVGAGGTARTIAQVLKDHQTPFHIVNRTVSKANTIAENFGGTAITNKQVKDLLKSIDLIFYTIDPNFDFLPPDWLPEGKIIFDVNYKTDIIRNIAKQKNIYYISGYELLFFQAIHCYNLFKIQTSNINFDQIRLNLKRKNKKSRIALTGFMGAGKSTTAQFLANKLQYELIDIDQLVEAETKTSISDIFHRRGEEEFRKVESKVFSQIEKKDHVVIATGGGFILEPQHRHSLNENFLTFWLHCDPIVARHRISDHSRPLLDKFIHSPRSIRELYNERQQYYFESSDCIISSEHQTSAEIAHKIFEEIRLAFPD